MRFRHTTLLALALAALSTAGQAATSTGMTELAFGAAYSSADTEGSKSTVFGFDVQGGYFVSDELEILGTVSYLKVDSDGSGEFDSTMFGGGVDYHINPDDDIVPFVGALFQIGTDEDDDITYFDVHAGVKYFLNEHVAVRLAVASATTERTTDFGFGEVEITTDSIDLSAGFSIFFP